MRVTESVLAGVKPGQNQKVDESARAARDRLNRLQSYLQPRLKYINADVLLAATKRADVDWAEYAKLVEHCSQTIECKPDDAPGLCEMKFYACMEGDLQIRVHSCDNLSWLPF